MKKWLFSASLILSASQAQAGIVDALDARDPLPPAANNTQAPREPAVCTLPKRKNGKALVLDVRGCDILILQADGLATAKIQKPSTN